MDRARQFLFFFSFSFLFVKAGWADLVRNRMRNGRSIQINWINGAENETGLISSRISRQKIGGKMLIFGLPQSVG